MDLYKFHSNPETLHGHDRADEIVPERIYDIAKSGKKLTDKQEDVIAKDPKYAYGYAYSISKKPFLKGEDAIAKDPEYAYYYAYLGSFAITSSCLSVSFFPDLAIL